MMRISIVTRRRSRLIATARRRQIRYIIVAGAMLALTLSSDIGALAQTNNASTNATAAKVYGPKQVGPWAVSGWTRNSGPYCTAERPLPGAAGRGATLQYIIAQSSAGYWLGLGSLDWELKSNASFPVELSAEPVLRSEANASHARREPRGNPTWIRSRAHAEAGHGVSNRSQGGTEDVQIAG
jgi:hypothetical protein